MHSSRRAPPPSCTRPPGPPLPCCIPRAHSDVDARYMLHAPGAAPRSMAAVILPAWPSPETCRASSSLFTACQGEDQDNQCVCTGCAGTQLQSLVQLVHGLRTKEGMSGVYALFLVKLLHAKPVLAGCRRDVDTYRVSPNRPVLAGCRRDVDTYRVSPNRPPTIPIVTQHLQSLHVRHCPAAASPRLWPDTSMRYMRGSVQLSSGKSLPRGGGWTAIGTHQG